MLPGSRPPPTKSQAHAVDHFSRSGHSSHRAVHGSECDSPRPPDAAPAPRLPVRRQPDRRPTRSRKLWIRWSAFCRSARVDATVTIFAHCCRASWNARHQNMGEGAWRIGHW
jgi:hypothetical protein